MTCLMKDTAKFVAFLRILEFVDLPYEVQTSQCRLIEKLIDKLTPDKAYDFLCADGIKKVTFAWKFHHPRIRKLLEDLVDKVVETGRQYLQVDPFVELTKCAITPI